MTWLPAAPAFFGLRPPELVWQPLSLPVAEMPPAWQILLSRFKGTPHIQRLATHHADPYGFYRLQGVLEEHDETVDWFVKLVEASQSERLTQAQAVADFVAQQGVLSPPLIDGFPLTLSENLVAFVYPFWSGRLTDYRTEDLATLGQEVGRLHRALAKYPQLDQVQQAGEARQAMLVARWRALLEDSEQIARLPTAVQTILNAHSPDWLSHLMEQGQMVHGDLNVGNLLFLENGRVAFLDFEDSLTAWFDPLKDLAFIVERFILTVHEPAKLDQFAHALLDAYFQAHPIEIRSRARFVDLIQALAIRAMLILAELTLSGRSVANSEWKKFVFLYNLSKQHQTELETITQPFIVTG